jgi:hypothetical protein
VWLIYNAGYLEGKPEVMFSVNQEFLKAAPDDGKPSKPIPPNHRFTLTGPGDQSPQCLLSGNLPMVGNS